MGNLRQLPGVGGAGGRKGDGGTFVTDPDELPSPGTGLERKEKVDPGGKARSPAHWTAALVMVGKRGSLRDIYEIHIGHFTYIDQEGVQDTARIRPGLQGTSRLWDYVSGNRERTISSQMEARMDRGGTEKYLHFPYYPGIFDSQR